MHTRFEPRRISDILDRTGYIALWVTFAGLGLFFLTMFVSIFVTAPFIMTGFSVAVVIMFVGFAGLIAATMFLD